MVLVTLALLVLIADFGHGLQVGICLINCPDPHKPDKQITPKPEVPVKKCEDCPVVYCPCKQVDQPCDRDRNCCDGLFCNYIANKCQNKVAEGGGCQRHLTCLSSVCGENQRCKACKKEGETCSINQDCCDADTIKLGCENGKCAKPKVLQN